MAVPFSAGALVHSTLETTYTPRAISQTYAADLDGDGISDLLVLGASYPGAGTPVAQASFVAFGNGDGTFRAAGQDVFPFATLKTVHPREVVFADLNGDGRQDVFVASHGYDAPPFPGEQNQLFLSTPDGRWTDATATLPQVIDYTHSAAAGDVDSDGDTDIVVGDQTPSSPPFVLLNDGTGHFTRNDTILPTGAGGALSLNLRRITSEALVDLDGDGKLDLVAGAGFSTSEQPVTSQVLWNTGGKYLTAGATNLPFPANFGSTQLVYDIQAIDVNYDGRQDLVVAYQRATDLGGWELQVLTNQGSRQFVDETVKYLPLASMRTGGMPSASDALSQYWVQFLDVADVNGDGRPDFTVNARGTTTAPTTLPVAYIHQADGTFAAATVAEIGGSSNPWMFDYSTVWAKFGGSGGFVHFGTDSSGRPDIWTLPVKFDPAGPVRADLLTTPQVLTGGASADLLTGGTANDRFTGAGGNDTITAGAGFDIATYSRARNDYSIDKAAEGFSVHANAGTEGVDSTSGLEQLFFSDMSVLLRIGADSKTIAPSSLKLLEELYVAFFNRVPDAEGLDFWIGQLGGGTSIISIADAFYAAGVANAATTGYTPGMTDSDFVRLVYQNVLGRSGATAPPAEDVAYWAGELASGRSTKGHLVTAMLESAHTFKGDATWGWVANLLDNKAEVANWIAVEQGITYNSAAASITKGIAVAAAVTATDTSAAIALVGVTDTDFSLVA